MDNSVQNIGMDDARPVSAEDFELRDLLIDVQRGKIGILTALRRVRRLTTASEEATHAIT